VNRKFEQPREEDWSTHDANKTTPQSTRQCTQKAAHSQESTRATTSRLEMRQHHEKRELDDD
jgi:hypothetical protein